MEKNKRQKDKNLPQNGPKMIVGLDIGTTKIVIMMGFLREDGKVEVCGYSKTPSVGVEFGSVFNVQDTVDAILQAKTSLENDMHETVSEVYVGIAGRHIKSTTCTHAIIRAGGNQTIIQQEEISKMTQDVENLSIPNESIIAVIPQDYCVNQTKTNKPVGALGERVLGTYQVITGITNEIFTIGLCLKKSNLIERKLILEPIASGLSCLTEEEKKQGVALIDIGGGTTDVIVFVDGVPVFTKVIPIGGQVITKDIGSLGISFDQAEYLKLNHGTCVMKNADKNNYITIPALGNYDESTQINESLLAKIINARVEKDILGVVKSELEKSGYNNEVHSIVLTGGGSELRDIRHLSEYVIQRKTRIGIPNVGFVPNLESTLKAPMYSTALGLLRYGCLTENQAFDVQSAREYFGNKEDNPEVMDKNDEDERGWGTKISDGLNKLFKLLINERDTE